MTPQHIIEAALLSSRRPMPVREIRRLFDDRLSAKSVKEHLAELQAFWEDRGMRLVELSDGWRFQTASELGPRFLRLDEEKPPRYSRAAMETLAIIAYHQPVTRGDIEELRGVTVNPATLRLFEERGWIETVGYRESPGRPALLATTRTFLNDLGLRSLAELPGPDAEPLPDFLLSEALPPSAAGLASRQSSIRETIPSLCLSFRRPFASVRPSLPCGFFCRYFFSFYCCREVAGGNGKDWRRKRKK